MLPYRILTLFFTCLCQQSFAAHPDFGPPLTGFPTLPFQASASAPGPHSHCALLIPGHGKSSSFDHTLDVFNGIHGINSGGDGFTCITFQSVDAAFIAARDKYGLPRPRKPVTSPDLGNLARVLVEATKIIAKQYSLPKDVIVNGLPLIDSMKSIVGTICYDFLKVKECRIERYRSYDGFCNNLKNPHWGSALTTFKRRIGPDYADGIDAPRVSKTGRPLPSARAVSAHVHRDEGLHDHAVTIMNVAWGQAIDHDLTLTAETKLPGTKKDPRCCDRDADFPECFPILVSQKDAFYALFKKNCLSVVRSVPGVAYNCKFGPRSQINEISAYIDANWVYGSSEKSMARLRLFKGGLLKSLPVFREFGLKDLLPLKLEDPEEGCIRPNKDLFCFDAGDGRVNEQLVLAVIHTMMMREHNRMATELGKINPHWSDEQLYQETRHIMAAVTQHITYNEYLPMVLGKEVMQKFGLILEKHGYFNGYDPKIDVSMSTDFITSAYRFGHSLLPSTIERWSPGHKYIASQRLSEMLRQPYDLYKGGWCDQFTMGLCNQVAQAMDDAVTQEVTNHLFQEPNHKFGMDLAALNMQRGREHGLPSYNEFRHFCGLHPIRSWHELEGVMPNKTVKRYVDVYRHPDDIDLWSGGVTERPLPGSMVGPTFACLIGLTFKELRYGDRFWYENKGFPSSFTPAQLEEIRKIKLSRMICDNSDDMKTVQVYVMVLPDHDINPRVPCASGILPKIDLTKWRDPIHGPIHPLNFKSKQAKPVSSTHIPSRTKQYFLNPLKQKDDPPSKNFPASRDPSLTFPTKKTPSSGLRFISQDLLTTPRNSSFLTANFLPFKQKPALGFFSHASQMNKNFMSSHRIGKDSGFPFKKVSNFKTNPNNFIPNQLIYERPLKVEPVKPFSHIPHNSFSLDKRPFQLTHNQLLLTQGHSWEKGVNSRPDGLTFEQNGPQNPISPVSPLHDPTVNYCECEDFQPKKISTHDDKPINIQKSFSNDDSLQKFPTTFSSFGLGFSI